MQFQSLQSFVSSGGCALEGLQQSRMLALNEELSQMDDSIRAHPDARNMQSVAEAVKSVLAPLAPSHDEPCQRSPEAWTRPLGIKPVPISQNVLFKLISLCNEACLDSLHRVLCGLFATEIDKAPLFVLQQALPSESCNKVASDISSSLPRTSALCILSQVSDLDRALKVCASWQGLLRSADAKAVFAPRMAPVADVFEEVLQPHNSTWASGATWQDAHALYRAIMSGTAAQEHLPQLVHASLKSLTLVAPQHLGQLTFFSALLVAVERAAACANGPVPSSAGLAAAEVMFKAVDHVRQGIMQRLSSLAHSPPPLVAVEHFTLLAQARELLSRSQELAVSNFPQVVSAQFCSRVSNMQDELSLNFSSSDRAVQLVCALPQSAVAASPLLARTLSGGFYRVLPQKQIDRLGLNRPTTYATHGIDEQKMPPLAFQCIDGAPVTVPITHLKPLARLYRHLQLFCQWRAMYEVERARLGAAPLTTDAERLQATPLNVHAHALHEMLDYSRAVTMTVAMGDLEQVRAQFKGIWMGQVRAQAGQVPAVRHCAVVAGCEEVAVALQDCRSDAGSCWC